MAEISLYDRLESDFKHNGVILTDILYCTVEEELNGMYQLELTHAIDGDGKWKELIEENIIKADGQLFRIHSTEKDLNYIYVHARHIYYDLLHNFLEDVRPTNINGAGALDWILSGTQYPHRFVGMSDISTLNTQYYIRKNPVEAMLGADSLVTRWNGELVRDNFTIKLLREMGSNKGASIAYGKNMLGLEVEKNMDTVATRIMPQGREELLLPEKYVDSALIGKYTQPYIKHIAFDIGVDEDTTQEQAYTQLRQACKDLYEIGKIDIPYVNIKADLLMLENTEEYKHLKNLVQVKLGDIVSCTDNPIDVSFESKVIRIKKDVLSNKNVEVELGQFKKGISNVIDNVIRDISEELKNTTSDLEKAIENATDLLTNALGGYVMKRPGELLIMDTEDVNTATKVWRFNLNGLGYSANGINGPYEVAMTMNGSINANFITTGSLSAGIIKTGVLRSANNYLNFNLDDGTFNIDKGSIKFTEDGIKVYHGSTTQYSQIDAFGLKRKWEHGLSKYLNDIYIGEFSSKGSVDYPIRISLPMSFRGREDTSIFLIPTDIGSLIGRLESDGTVSRLTSNFYNLTRILGERVLDELTGKYERVLSMDMNASPPWVDIEAYNYEYYATISGGQVNYTGRRTWVEFMLIAIGE